jgi:uncharacterized RDD family membrane protein YckC
VAPGWYKDPAEPSTQRYWDGEGWVGAPLPADATPPPGPPPEEAPSPPPPSPPAPAGAAAPTSPVYPGQGYPLYPGQGYPLPPGSNQVPGTGQPPGTGPASGGTGPPAAGTGPPAAGQPYAPPAPPGALPPRPVPPGGMPPGAVPPGGPYSGMPYPMATAPAGTIGVPLASPGARFLARLVDITAVLLLNVVVNGWFCYRYWLEVEPMYRELNQRLASGAPLSDVMADLPQPGPQAGTLQLVILFIATALWFAYEVPAVANTGQTLGKRLTGIKVVGMEGSARLGFGRSLRRWNILGFPTLLWACCIGFVWQLVDCVYLLFDRPLQQAFHDKAARTVVVQVPKTLPTTPGGSP